MYVEHSHTKVNQKEKKRAKKENIGWCALYLITVSVRMQSVLIRPASCHAVVKSAIDLSIEGLPNRASLELGHPLTRRQTAALQVDPSKHYIMATTYNYYKSRLGNNVEASQLASYFS